MSEKPIEMNLVKRIDPSATISAAVAQGVDKDYLETLKGLFELQLRDEENEAKKAYHEAMAKFKANPPDITKDRHVKYLKVDYHHASLANVTKKINIGLSEQGLSATWSTGQDNGNVTVACTITHKLGHSESTSLTAAPDDSGSKNSIQAIGSTVSYLQRYTILALTGLATSDMDTDGVTSQVEYINEDQQIEINDAISELYADKGKVFLEWLKVDSVEAIPARQYKQAIQALKDMGDKK